MSRCETRMVVKGVGHSAAKEEAMDIKASEVGKWLRKSAGKRDHHELMSEDYVVVRPGPNFHWLMGQGSPSRTEPLPPAPGLTSIRDDRHGTGADDKAA